VYFVSRGVVLSSVYTLYKYTPLSGTITTIVDSTTWNGLVMPFIGMGMLEISSTGTVYLLHSGYVALFWFDPATSTSSSISGSAFTGYLRSFALDSTDTGWVMTYDYISGTTNIYQFDSTTPSSAAKTLKFTSSVPNATSSSTGNNFLSCDAGGNVWALLRSPTSLGASSFNYDLNKIGPSISIPDVSVQVCSNCSVNEIFQWTGSTLIRGDGTVETYNSNAELVGTISVDWVTYDYSTSSNRFPREAPSGDLLFYQASGLPNIIKLDTSTGETTSLKSYVGGVSEWFMCGSDNQAAVPSTEEALSTACALNGVKWSAAAASGTGLVFFSDAEYASLLPTCDSTLYTRICDVVGALPPYVCTKEEPTSLTNYLGVAAANAELLYIFLVFLSGFVFSAISYPESDIENLGEESATGLELTSIGGDSTGFSKNLALEMAMAAMKKDMTEDMAALKKESEVKAKKIAMMEKEMIETKKEVAAGKKEMSALKAQLNGSTMI
jgi:hypothetical protein